MRRSLRHFRCLQPSPNQILVLIITQTNFINSCFQCFLLLFLELTYTARNIALHLLISYPNYPDPISFLYSLISSLSLFIFIVSYTVYDQYIIFCLDSEVCCALLPCDWSAHNCCLIQKAIFLSNKIGPFSALQKYIDPTSTISSHSRGVSLMKKVLVEVHYKSWTQTADPWW